MTDDSNSPAGDGSGKSRFNFTLKPTYKQTHPNPHAHSRGWGRSPLPTPATLSGHVWRLLGVESHVALTTLVVPVLALIAYLYTIGIALEWLGVFCATILVSYAIYYSWAPREAKHVIARLENVYHAKRFAVISSGIAVLSILSTAILIFALVVESYVHVKAAPTSITIATIGMGIGLLSSYILIRVLVARALPIQSNEPLLDRVVGMGPMVEVAFILAAIGAPVFILAAQFLWNRPALVTFDVAITRDAAGMLLAGFAVLYTSLITRM